MRTPSPLSLLLFPFVAALVVLGALLSLPLSGLVRAGHPGTSARPASTRFLPASCVGKDCGAGMVEMEVKDVIPLRDADTHAVVLVSKDSGTILPIFVDEGSAVAIAFRLAHRNAPHPLAHDLLDKVVSELGGTVTEVRIDGLEGQVYSGHLFITQGQRHLELEARPSDSIAMALTRGAKIFATRQVLSAAGITREDISKMRQKMGPGAPPDLEDQGPGVGGSGPIINTKKSTEISL